MGQVCAAGRCDIVCAAPAVKCPTATGEACFELSSDLANCGACGARCTGGKTCLRGACVSTQCLPAELPCGVYPELLATSDFNGDGRPDMVVATSADASVSVILSNGAAGFAPHVVYPLPAEATSLVIADFDLDGISDFAVLPMFGTQLLTFSGRDGGSFIAGPTAAVAPNSRDVAVGDFNSDARPDLFVQSQTSPLSLLLGRVDGGFSPARAFDAGTQNYSIVGVADFDSDGHEDVMVARSFGIGSEDLLILYGDGASNFVPSAPLGSDATDYVRIGDVNGDGRPDITGLKYHGSPGSSLVVILNRGSRTFERASETAPMSRPAAVVLGDLNGDGRPEVIVTFGSLNGLGVLMNRGDGSFLAPAVYAQFGARSPVVADFTGDSVPDVAVCSPDQASVSVLPNIGDGRLVSPHYYGDGFLSHLANSVRLADLDGDGSLDLVDVLSTNPGRQLAIRYNQGNGHFGPAASLPAPPTTESLVALDIEGDGSNDVVTADRAGTLSIFTNQRDAGFLSFRSIDAGFGAVQVKAADFNSDQRPDLVVGGDFGLGVFLNGGSFSGPVGVVSSATTFTQVEPGDFNGDGLQDLAVTEGQSGLEVLWGLADGGFAPAGASLSQGALIGSGDFDGDGKPDLAVNDNREVQLFLNARDGGFVAAAPVSVQGLSRSFAVGDLNGDGRSDLAVAHSATREPRSLTLLVSSPSGPLTKRASFPLGFPLRGVATGDLDGDGRLDVAVSTDWGSQVFLNVCLP